MKSTKYSRRTDYINVGDAERAVSAVAGAALVAYGLKNPGNIKFPMGLLGAALVYRGLRGHCKMYEALGANSATTTHPGINVSKRIMVSRAPSDLYAYWRNLENIPRVMTHIESVKEIDSKHSRWSAKMPLGFTMSWDAEITAEQSGDYIAWKSLPGSTIENIGSVQFTPNGIGGTEVKVHLRYNPPAGKVGAAFAKLIGEDPESMIADDLEKFKSMMERGSTFQHRTNISAHDFQGQRSVH